MTGSEREQAIQELLAYLDDMALEQVYEYARKGRRAELEALSDAALMRELHDDSEE